MRMSKKGKIELATYEGLSTKIYFDSVGVRTIGIGATVSEIPDIKKLDMATYELTIPEVFDLFDKSLKKYEDAVNKGLKVEVSQEQFDALVSITYNIGTGGFLKSTFLKRINAKMSMDSIVQAILMWRKPPEIIGRRKREAELFSKGKYSSNGKVQLYTTDGRGRLLHSKSKTISVIPYLG